MCRHSIILFLRREFLSDTSSQSDQVLQEKRWLSGPLLACLLVVAAILFAFNTDVQAEKKPDCKKENTGNSAVPSCVTTVPINTKYTAGFGLGVSFTKP